MCEADRSSVELLIYVVQKPWEPERSRDSSDALESCGGLRRGGGAGGAGGGAGLAAACDLRRHAGAGFAVACDPACDLRRGGVAELRRQAGPEAEQARE